MSEMKKVGFAVKCDGSINGIENSSLEGKFIELNGDRYVKVSELESSEVVTAKLMEYVDSINAKHASIEEIEVLLKIHRVV